MSWQPVETAPRTGERFLAVQRQRVVICKWDDDRYSKRPQPYFRCESSVRRNFDTENPITLWQPLPAIS